MKRDRCVREFANYEIKSFMKLKALTEHESVVVACDKCIQDAKRIVDIYNHGLMSTHEAMLSLVSLELDV